MESKLKSLKVADLKDILSKAQQPPPAKATKTDLIARILASKEATDVYNAKFAPKDDLLAPPEDLDWDDQVNSPAEAAKPPPAPVAKAPAVKPVSAAKPVTAPPPAHAPTSDPAPALTPEPTTTTGSKTAEELELEKRRQRAQRFGIPLVEQKSPAVKKSKAAVASAAKQPDATEKLSARAARFGTGKKRPAPAEDVDLEEQERRRKRAERFGTATEASA
ncbi:hypothetical protein K438DRAFT_2011539 [Mycena galopus ATCC 62051]|nr:hypothetical protein K438DRAFT_2011539 [Mycena galopus ATCC 62051]